MNTIDYGSMVAGAEAAIAKREDVVTVAKRLRNGEFGLQVICVQNGFIVYAGTQTIICTKANDVGLLVRTLYSGDLDNEKITKRLRRMMGYR